MKRHHLGLCGLCVQVAGIFVVGALAFGVPASNLWTLALVALCPLMMIFMMQGMHGGSSDGSGQQESDDQHEQIRRP